MWVVAGMILGLVAGSFIATLVLRWPAARSLGGRSACDSCGVPLAPNDMVPLLSFALLRGRCRRCGAAIDWRHPLIEAAAALLGGVALAAVPGPAGFSTALFAWFLLALLLLDTEHHWLPDRLTLPLLALGIALGPGVLAERLAAAAIAGGSFLALHLLYRRLRGRDGLGLGDVKLAAALGAWTGTVLLAPLLFLAALIGLGFVGFARLRGERLGATDAVPFGACLAIAALPAHLAATQLV
jgi:leader peptidase (prepilin peptidase)/N-methyltransferase